MVNHITPFIYISKTNFCFIYKATWVFVVLLVLFRQIVLYRWLPFRDLWCIVKCEVNIIKFLLIVTVHLNFLVLVHMWILMSMYVLMLTQSNRFSKYETTVSVSKLSQFECYKDHFYIIIRSDSKVCELKCAWIWLWINVGDRVEFKYFNIQSLKSFKSFAHLW